MGSDEFDQLHQEIVSTVNNNYTMLMNCLSSKDKRKLNALFD
jgi:hemerythrin